MSILPPLPRPQRRRIHKIIHATRDKGHARRLMAILLLHEGRTVTEVHHHLTGWPCSSLTGRQDCHITGATHAVFSARFLLSAQPLVYRTIGYQNQLVNVAQYGSIHAPPMVTSYGHCLAKARADLADKRPGLSGEKMANIDATLVRSDADNPVFYEDEVDIDLNSKLGANWMFRAQQKRVVTPGQNAKHYLAGVIHAGNGRVLYVSGIKKNSSQFIAMLEKLRRHYRRAKTITLILDNYIIHKSKQTERWLKKNPKFCLVFLQLLG